MNWFKQNGDKVLALLTVALLGIQQNAAALGLNAHAVAWAALVTSVLTAAHVLFYPNGAAAPKS